jgi:dTDP-4-amino-4,6-dideoxygalactose transaminase
LAVKARMFANHGALIKHQHLIEGINSRLDGLQSAILLVKLKYIEKWNSDRLDHALYYNEKLGNIKEIEVPKIRSLYKHIFHIYCIRAQKRDQLQKYLKENGIETAIHYPSIIPLLKAYKYLNYNEGDFPVCADYQDKILSLPMYPELTYNEIDYITELIAGFYKR